MFHPRPEDSQTLPHIFNKQYKVQIQKNFLTRIIHNSIHHNNE
jgi:hypothetical protein